MPDSICHLAVHIVFSTRNRQTWLKSPQKEELHTYLIGIINNIGGKSIRINGTEDHVHILCLLPKDISPVEFMAKIKSNSSKWFRTKHNPQFHWQDGYGMFSVSRSQIPDVERYIVNQDEHHFNTSSWDEFDLLLKKHMEQDSD